MDNVPHRSFEIHSGWLAYTSDEGSNPSKMPQQPLSAMYRSPRAGRDIVGQGGREGWTAMIQGSNRLEVCPWRCRVWEQVLSSIREIQSLNHTAEWYVSVRIPEPAHRIEAVRKKLLRVRSNHPNNFKRDISILRSLAPSRVPDNQHTYHVHKKFSGSGHSNRNRIVPGKSPTSSYSSPYRPGF